jgi:cyclohexanecarboxylate-CoA ligase
VITRDDYRRPIAAAGDLEALRGMTLWEAFCRARDKAPDRPCLIEGEHVLSWDAVSRLSERVASRFLEIGVGPGDVVGLHLPNGRAFVLAHLALAKIGAVTATLHMPYGTHELERMLGFTEAKAVVLPARFHNSQPWRNLEEVWPRLPHLKWAIVVGGGALSHPRALRWEDWLEAPASSPSWPRVEAEDPFALFFTSGTEAPEPKACLHSHDTLVSNAAWVVEEAPLAAEDVVLSGSPFTHLFGILSLHMALVVGATQVLLDRFTPEDFLQACTQHRVSFALAVPAQIRDVLSHLAQHPLNARLWLRELRTGGAWAPPSLAGEVRQHLGAGLVFHWGMSELGAGVYTHWTDQEIDALSTIGRPTKGSEVAVYTEEGVVSQAPEAQGELLFRGPSLFLGYYRNPAVTDRSYVWEDGRAWFRTGDQAQLRRDGRVTFLGRVKDIINRGGMKVSVLELESLLGALPGVEALAIVPEPDPRLGERAVLVYQGNQEISLEMVRELLKAEGVAKYKWPERVLRLSQIPRTPTGKVARGALRALVSAAEEAR